MPRPVSINWLILTLFADIQEIERDIHEENKKLAERTNAQRYTIDYYKREINNLKDMNTHFKRDININQGTETEYQARAV